MIVKILAQIKKVVMGIDHNSSKQHEYDDYNTDRSQDSQTNSDLVYLDEIEDLNINNNYYIYAFLLGNGLETWC